MAESDLQSIFYGLIIFALFMTAGFSILTMGRAVDASLDDVSGYNASFNIYNNVQTTTSGLQSNIEDTEAGTGSTGSTDNLIVASWNTLKNMPSTLGFAFTTLNNAPQQLSFLGIPYWATGIAAMLLIIAIAFAIYAAIFQRKL